ncbi:MAG: response regulator transcription factor [Candidatus Promineifilaceae bacterium]
MTREATILLLEGKSAAGNSLRAALEKEVGELAVVTTANEAVEWVQRRQPDLIVLNAASMRSSGVRTSRRLRRALPDAPIIHCRDADQVEDRSAEADVYLRMPFTGRKLINRIRALLPVDDLKEEIVRAGQLTFYLSKRSVEVAGQGERRLTPKLARLLQEFLRHPNEVLGREQLMQQVWNTTYFGDTRTLDVHIRWMREIIERNPADPSLLRTVRGVGYIFAVPPGSD